MNAVPFDTLKFAQRLEAAGMARPTAAGAAEALAEAMSGADLATKSDIAALRSELRTEMSALRNEMHSGAELLRRELTIRLGSMMMVGVGVLLAAMRFLPPHP